MTTNQRHAIDTQCGRTFYVYVPTLTHAKRYAYEEVTKALGVAIADVRKPDHRDEGVLIVDFH